MATPFMTQAPACEIGIADLPPELLNKCLATLTFQSLQQVRQTCKTLYRAVQSIHDNDPSVEHVSRERGPLLMDRTDLLSNYDQHFRHGNACLFSVWVRDNTFVRIANRLQPIQKSWTVDTTLLFPQIPVAAVHLNSQPTLQPAQNFHTIHQRNTGPLRVSYTHITSLDYFFGGVGMCNVTELWLHSCIVPFSLDQVIDFFPKCDKFRFTLSHFHTMRVRIQHLELWGRQDATTDAPGTSRHAFSHVCCEVSERLRPWTHSCTHVAVRQLLVMDYFRDIFPNATHLTLNGTQIFGSTPCIGITELTVRDLSANIHPRLGTLFPDLTSLIVHTSVLWNLTLTPFPQLQQLCVYIQGSSRTHVQTIVGRDALNNFQQKYLEHKLPSSVWTRVCHHLDFDSLSTAAQTCRDLRTIATRLNQDTLPWYPNNLRPCATRLLPRDAHLWLLQNASRETMPTTPTPQVEASGVTPTLVESGESTRMESTGVSQKRKQWNGFPTVLGDSMQEHATGICKVNTWTNPWNHGVGLRYLSCAQAAALPGTLQTRFGNQFAFAVRIKRGDAEQDIQTVLERNYLIDSLDVDPKTPSLAFYLKPRKVNLFDFKIRSPKMHQVMFELNTPLELHLENCEISHAALLWMTNILNHKRINLTMSHCRHQKESHKTHPVVFHQVSIVPVLCRRQQTFLSFSATEANASRPVDFEWMYSVHIDGNHEDISHTCAIVEQMCSFRMVHLRLHHCKDLFMVTQCPTVEWLEIVDGDVFLQYDWSGVAKINLVQGSITPWTRLPNLKELYVDSKRDTRDPIDICLSRMVRVILHQPAHLPPILLRDRDTRVVSEVRDWEQESQVPPAKKRRLS